MDWVKLSGKVASRAPLPFWSRNLNERKLKIILHAGMDMHKRFSVVKVADDSGNEVVKGKNPDFLYLEMGGDFQAHSAKWVKTYPDMPECGR